MIKLIATDMDGTLLDDSKNLPANFEDVISALRRKNIKFVISSGRSFSALKKQFGSHLEDLIFICDNGAYIVIGGEVAHISVIPQQTVNSVVDMCQEKGYTAILCGKKGAWHDSAKAQYNSEIAAYYNDCNFVDDLHDRDDEFFKIAIYNESGFTESQYDDLCERFPDNTVQLSGKYWVDIMNKGVNKGAALSGICNRLGVGYNNVMAFGDYLNDVDMLGCAYYSFAMSNAHNTVKQAANFITGSNNDNSVMKEVKKYCLQ